MRALITTVHVHDDNGRRHVFEPGQVPPDWAQKKITNPKVWAPDRAEGADPAGTGGSELAVSDPVPALPPRSGAGSGKEAWAEYAAAAGLEVPDGAARDDIIALLEQAGIATRPPDPAHPEGE